MRWAVVLAVVAACSFDHGFTPVDGAPDTPVDTMIVPTWAIDTASGKAVPQSTAEWSRLVGAYTLTASPPDHLWLMQETSGSLADSVGSASLAPLNAPTYANAVSGWTRLAVGTPDLDANEGFLTNQVGNLDGTSYMVLLYVAVTAAPATDRTILGFGAGTDYRYLAVTKNPVYKATGLGGVAPTTGTVSPTTTVHPIVLEVDATHQRYVAYSDIDLLPVAWTPTSGAGALVSIGSAANGSASARYLFGALWQGGHAELTDFEVKKLLQALGWSVTGF